MKKAIHFFAFVLLISCSLQAQKQNPQSTITEAFYTSFASEQSNLDPIIARWQIQDLSHSEKYWPAYACQQNGIVYMSKKNMGKAEENISLAIRTLKNIEELTSEYHALLGSLLGLSITFDPTNAMQLSVQSNKHYKKSLKKDPNNMRAYLGIGKGYFYTPVEYGGGKVVEQNLQKALALPAKSSETSNGPSWGRDEAFMFLAQFYEREDRKSEAMLICKKGLKEFPDHGPLKDTMEKVKG